MHVQIVLGNVGHLDHYDLDPLSFELLDEPGERLELYAPEGVVVEGPFSGAGHVERTRVVLLAGQHELAGVGPVRVVLGYERGRVAQERTDPDEGRNARQRPLDSLSGGLFAEESGPAPRVQVFVEYFSV